MFRDKKYKEYSIFGHFTHCFSVIRPINPKLIHTYRWINKWLANKFMKKSYFGHITP